MPEREFELYLSLLSRLLRLDPTQREQIADELRDHFQDRFEELVGSGLAREEALRATLDEFGDAAGLAAGFSHIGNRRKRRMIMRCTLGTAAGLVAAIFLASAFWPEGPAVQGPARAVAQQPAPPEAAAPTTRQVAKSHTQSAVEAKLEARRLPPLDFEDTPFKDVLSFLSDANEVDILVSPRAFEGSGASPDHLITLSINHTTVTARTALELVLEQVSSDLGYTVRDGLIYITQKHDNNEIQVYNVRDLLNDHLLRAAGMMGAASMPGMGMMPGGGEGAYGGGGAGLGGGPVGPGSTGAALLAVITTTIYPDTWQEVGGSGSVAEFNGLLIVKQSQTVHRQIAQLLDMMREVGQRDAPAALPLRPQ